MKIVFKVAIENRSTKQVYFSDDNIIYEGDYIYDTSKEDMVLNCLGTIFGEFKIKKEGKYRTFLDIIEFNGVEIKEPFQIPIKSTNKVLDYTLFEGDNLTIDFTK